MLNTTANAKKKVKAVQIIGTQKRTSNSYGKNLRYTSYRVFVTKTENGEKYQREISDVFTATELKELSYWSNRSLTMAMTCWGTSQQFEAKLALMAFLNPQKKGEEWGEFCRRAENFIKEM